MRRCREIASWVFFLRKLQFYQPRLFFNCYVAVWLQVNASKTEQFWESVLLKNRHMGVPMYCFLWSGRTSWTPKKTLPKFAAMRCSCSKNKKRKKSNMVQTHTLYSVCTDTHSCMSHHAVQTNFAFATWFGSRTGKKARCVLSCDIIVWGLVAVSPQITG